MWIVRATLALLVIVCVVAFAFYNIGPGNEVDVNLIYVKYAGVPMITVVFWSFVGGMFVSLLLFVSVYIRLSVQTRTLRKRVKSLEGEVTVLRNRPIEESANLLSGRPEPGTKVKSSFDLGVD